MKARTRFGSIGLLLTLAGLVLLGRYSRIGCKDCAKIVQWQLGLDSRGAPAAAGVARSDCPYSLRYVELFAHFYDADDIEIGAYWHIMAGVLPGEEWGFQIECHISAIWSYVGHAAIKVHVCTPAS